MKSHWFYKMRRDATRVGRLGVALVLLSAMLAPHTATAQTSDGMSTYSVIAPSLAFVIAKDGKHIATGTAFCIGNRDGDAYFLTNRHVIATDSAPAMVMGSDPSSLSRGQVVRVSTMDAAVVAVDSATCSPLKLSTSPPPVGTRIAIAGYPYFQLVMSEGNLRDLAPSFHEGSVSGMDVSAEFIEYDAQTDHGNSGSPLVDAQSGIVYGLVMGVNTGKTGALQNNIAISVNALQTFLVNAHANVSFAAAPAPAAAAMPMSPQSPIAAAVDSHCGAGTSAQIVVLAVRSQSELNASDNANATADAQRTVEVASQCAFALPAICTV
ncbi:MAG TPA: serine protease [Candidatus Tyrphobacter sp.]